MLEQLVNFILALLTVTEDGIQWQTGLPCRVCRAVLAPTELNDG